jgi:hypothetical protein
MQTAQIPDCVMSVWKSISSVNSVESYLNQYVEVCGSAIWKPKNSVSDHFGIVEIESGICDWCVSK